ncbi:AAA family ATPase [Agrobacterium sp. T29]|uniref:AAA family ATPase n=1 Tax=Agrobacterium sp. T29 TaxID=2580515 RepID=UPI00115C5262|nr:AAA family ATPase [Agrobacterium sp. T29]
MPAPFLRRLSYAPPGEEKGFPFNVPLFTREFEIAFERPITIFCGENGSGKSTLLETIAKGCGFNPGGGNAHVYASRDDLNDLVESCRFAWLPKTSKGFFFRAESFFNYATYIDDLARQFGSRQSYRPYGGKSLHAQSHGESFLSLFAHRIGGKGVYIFDEPEAALSPMRQLAFLALLREILRSGDSQIIMATHSPILLGYPDSQLLQIADGAIEPTTLRETEHYIVMRRFLEEPDRYIGDIFSDDL